jgi:hypothetical protein
MTSAIAAAVMMTSGVMVGGVGWTEKSAFSSEVDISIEANPYCKLSPGCASEVQYPAYLSMLRVLKRIGEKGGLPTLEEKAETEEPERKWKFL